MKLREVVIEESKKDVSKIVDFFLRVLKGKVEKQNMRAAGFKIENPVMNSEDRLAETLGIFLDINVTENEINQALKEINIKNVKVLVKKWVEKNQKEE